MIDMALDSSYDCTHSWSTKLQVEQAVLKRRGRSWKLTLGLAAIAIAAFVLFDVLDLDASQLRAPLTDSVLTEDSSVAIGRFCAMKPIPDAFGASLYPPSQTTAVDAPRPSALVRRLHALRSATLVRNRLTRASASGSGSAADPV